MKFYAAITGDLILISRPAATGPHRAVVGHSVNVRDAAIIRFVLWLLTWLAPVIPRPVRSLCVTNMACVSFLAIVGMFVLEALAQSHVEQALGVIA